MDRDEWAPIFVEVQGLFGYATHRVKLSRQSPVTIIAGPNGCGKTHLLRILKAFLSVDFGDLLALPFSKAEVILANGTRISAIHLEGMEIKEISVRVHLGLDHDQFTINSEEFIVDESEDLPSWVRRLGDGRWFDMRSDRFVTARELERRYGVTVGSEKQRRRILDRHPLLKAISENASTTFIDTRRLDSLGRVPSRDEYLHYGAITSSDRDKAGRIGHYITQVRQQISEARRESLVRSQQADEKFASNLLKRSKKTVRQESLVRSYERLSKLSAELSSNGLAGRALSVKIPPNADAIETRVLDLFLRDWERKLEPLLPVHRKLTTLTRIVNEKFVGKSLVVDAHGVLQFKNDKGDEVRVDQLSSGEQHLLALFTLLLFSADAGSVVLIDEPEISLHAAWKHAFVSDIEQVSELNNLTVVLATHSTAVINGRWDLVQEIGLVE